MFWLRIAPYVLAAVLAGGGIWWVMDLRADNVSLRADNAALQRELAVAGQIADQAREARDIANAYRERETARAAGLQKGIEALISGDFENAEIAIDTRIADYLECLREADPGQPDTCSGSLGGSADPSADQ